MLLTCTQDYVLGYSQPSLRDSTVGVERRRSGAKARRFLNVYGPTKVVPVRTTKPSSHTDSKALIRCGYVGQG
jgi:hypothetical protein